MLQTLTAMRGEFAMQSQANNDGGSPQLIRPAISTFSDHIVVSFPMKAYTSPHGVLYVVAHFRTLVSAIAAAALRLGFLIRGGATLGKLFHRGDIAFGEALVEAFVIESRTAIYPRIVLSQRIVAPQPDWLKHGQPWLCRDHDGLYCLDYTSKMLHTSAVPGDNYSVAVREWFTAVVPIIDLNIRRFEQSGELNKLAKWTWFARQFGEALKNTQELDQFGISLAGISWLANS